MKKIDTEWLGDKQWDLLKLLFATKKIRKPEAIVVCVIVEF